MTKSTVKTNKGRVFHMKSVLFRAWELQYLVSAMRMKYTYECLEYGPNEEKIMMKLIGKLERNAASQAEIEGIEI